MEELDNLPVKFHCRAVQVFSIRSCSEIWEDQVLTQTFISIGKKKRFSRRSIFFSPRRLFNFSMGKQKKEQVLSQTLLISLPESGFLGDPISLFQADNLMFWLSRRIFLLEDDYLIFYRKTKDSSMNYFVERWIKGKFRFQCETVQINS